MSAEAKCSEFVEKKVGMCERRLMNDNYMGFEVLRFILMIFEQFMIDHDGTWPLRHRIGYNIV